MKAKRDPHLLAEQVCMADIISAIENLSEHYCGALDKGDSVAEGQANRAIVRCLQWVVNFKIPHAFIAGREQK